MSFGFWVLVDGKGRVQLSGGRRQTTEGKDRGREGPEGGRQATEDTPVEHPHVPSSGRLG